MQFSNLSYKEFLKYGGLSPEVVARISEYKASEWGDIEDLEERIDELESENESLSDENYEYSNRIDELEDQVKEMQDKIDELESEK